MVLGIQRWILQRSPLNQVQRNLRLKSLQVWNSYLLTLLQLLKQQLLLQHHKTGY